MGKNQKGFTLVELLIAIAIMSIVLAAVCGFIIVGSRSYANANSDITVQQESQLALNQMSDVLIDTTRSVNYVGYDSGGTPSFALKDSEFTATPEDKALIMYNGESTIKADGTVEMGEGNGNLNYQFLWDRSEETLYYSEIPVTESSFPSVGEAGCVVLAEHVTDFAADLSQVEEKRVVQLTLTFEMGGKTYTTANNVTIRNKVLINDAEIEPLNKSVTLAVTPKKASVILEPGEQYHFSTPKVSGTNVLDKSVKWSIEGSGSGDPLEGGSTPDGSAIIDADNGIIQISSSEKATQFNVVITTNAKDSEGNPATATVIVNVKRANDVSLSKTADTNESGESLAPNQVTAGRNFFVTGEAIGNKLGVTCDSCAADTSKDKYLCDWKVIEGADVVSVVTSDYKEAEFSLASGVESGTEIVIEATALISVDKHYSERVTGQLRLIVAAGEEYDYSGDWKYGKTEWFSEFDTSNPQNSTEYLLCIRIRESRTINVDTDRVIIYRTNGMAGINLDTGLLGLDVTKPYYISAELLDPGRGYNGSKDSAQPAITDYLAHIDRGTGKYNGTAYKSGGMITGRLNPPEIRFNYNWSAYENGTVIGPLNRFRGNVSLYFSVVDVVNVLNANEFLNNGTKFKVYYQENPQSEWQYLYGYNLDNKSYSDGSSSQFENMVRFRDFHNPLNFCVEASGNKGTGRYRISPILEYNNYGTQVNLNDIFYINYEGNYNLQTVDLSEKCSIYFDLQYELETNLESFFVTENGVKKEYKLYFPTPEEQEFTNIFGLYNDSTPDEPKVCPWGWGTNIYEVEDTTGASGKYFSVSKAICTYVRKEKTYEVEFQYSYWDGNLNQTAYASYGTYKWDVKEKKWIFVK